MKSLGGLWEATRDLHHRAESHPLAVKMVNGTISAQEWADWLGAHKIIQDAMDPHLPPNIQRARKLWQDLRELEPIEPVHSPIAEAYAKTLVDPVSIFGGAYLTIGAHRRGGQVIERAMREKGVTLPAHHIRFDDPQDAELFVKRLREQPELAPGARRAFEALYDVMEEIDGRY